MASVPGDSARTRLRGIHGRGRCRREPRRRNTHDLARGDHLAAPAAAAAPAYAPASPAVAAAAVAATAAAAAAAAAGASTAQAATPAPAPQTTASAPGAPSDAAASTFVASRDTPAGSPAGYRAESAGRARNAAGRGYHQDSGSSGRVGACRLDRRKRFDVDE